TVNLLVATPDAVPGTRNLSFEVVPERPVGKSKPFVGSQDSFALADNNGDGRADVVNWVLTSFGVQGNGLHYSFSASVAYALDTHRDVWRMLAADVNGDGSMDLVRADGWQ